MLSMLDLPHNVEITFVKKYILTRSRAEEVAAIVFNDAVHLDTFWECMQLLHAVVTAYPQMFANCNDLVSMQFPACNVVIEGKELLGSTFSAIVKAEAAFVANQTAIGNVFTLKQKRLWV